MFTSTLTVVPADINAVPSVVDFGRICDAYRAIRALPGDTKVVVNTADTSPEQYTIDTMLQGDLREELESVCLRAQTDPTGVPEADMTLARIVVALGQKAKACLTRRRWAVGLGIVGVTALGIFLARD